jgi:hypothetical protein
MNRFIYAYTFMIFIDIDKFDEEEDIGKIMCVCTKAYT